MTHRNAPPAQEVADDDADSLLDRREALRRLGLLGFAATAALPTLAACGAAGQTPSAGEDRATQRPATSASRVGTATETVDDTAGVLLFHHGHGLTTGVRDFAEELRSAGHTVYTPDLYDGQVFDELEEGLAYARKVGFDAIIQRGQAAAEKLPDGMVYAGFSLGVMPAQKLAQTRAGAKGALLFDACLPVSEFGQSWPSGVPVQVHGMDADPYFADGGDLAAARELVRTSPDAELFLYPGKAHLFADSSLPAYDPRAAALLKQRVLALLRNVR